MSRIKFPSLLRAQYCMLRHSLFYSWSTILYVQIYSTFAPSSPPPIVFEKFRKLGGIFLSVKVLSITKTRLYNSDPLKPHFYIVKLGLTGVYIIFLISALNIDCGYSLELPLRGSSNEYPQSMF